MEIENCVYAYKQNYLEADQAYNYLEYHLVYSYQLLQNLWSEWTNLQIAIPDGKNTSSISRKISERQILSISDCVVNLLVYRMH